MKPALHLTEAGFIAEVLESSLSHVAAQFWHSETIAPFGSIVAIYTPHRTFFGVIANIKTGPVDPGRRPTTFGLEQAELQRQQPQLFHFIKTSCDIIIVGSKGTNGQTQFAIPPHPPSLHSLVRPATNAESNALATNPYSMQQVLCAQALPVDKNELLLAMFAHLNAISTITPTFIQNFYDLYATLLQSDSRQTRLFLKRLQTCLKLVPESFSQKPL